MVFRRCALYHLCLLQSKNVLPLTFLEHEAKCDSWRLFIFETSNEATTTTNLHREATAAKVEQILQRGAEQVHDEHIVLALGSIPEYSIINLYCQGKL